MPKKIVLICGGYYPAFSAAGNCIRQIANEFIRKGSQVQVICKSIDGSESFDEFEGQKIYRVTNNHIKNLAAVASVGKSIRGKVNKIYIKSIWALRLLFSRDGMDDCLVNSFIEKLEELLPGGIDAVLPCCMPAEAIKAGYLFCHKTGIPLFPILYDRYSENVFFFRFKWNQKLRYKKEHRLEEDIFDCSNIVYYID